MHLNRVELIGGLLDRPKLEEPGGFPVARFTLAIPETWWNPEAKRDEVRTQYIGCLAVGNMALQIIVDDLAPGAKVWVLGHLDQTAIPTEDGKKDQKTRVRVALYRPLSPRVEVV